MAKSRKTLKQSENEGNVKKLTTPSWYGSHKSMAVASDGRFDESLSEEEIKEITEKFGLVSAGRVVCRDEYGFYLTYKNRLDNGLADSLRYSRR